MPARSLKDMVISKCIKRRNEIEDIGDEMPYELARPFLLKIEVPDRLRLIELNSPHIVPYTGELWKNLIKNILPSTREKVDEMKDEDVNYKVYKKFIAEHEEQDREAQKELEAKMAAINAKKASRQSILIDPKKRGLKVPVDRNMRAGFLASERAQVAIQGKSTHSKRPQSTGSGGRGGPSLIAKLEKGGFNKFALFPTNQVPQRMSKITTVPKTMIKLHPTPPVARATASRAAESYAGTSSASASPQRQLAKRKGDDLLDAPPAKKSAVGSRAIEEREVASRNEQRGGIRRKSVETSSGGDERPANRDRMTPSGFGNAGDANRKLATSSASAKSRDIPKTTTQKESSTQQGRVQPRDAAQASSKAGRDVRPADHPKKPAEPGPKPMTKLERVQAEKDEKARRRAAAVAAAAERRRAVMS